MYFFFFKQKTAYEMRISDWSSDVCSSDLRQRGAIGAPDRTPLPRELPIHEPLRLRHQDLGYRLAFTDLLARTRAGDAGPLDWHHAFSVGELSRWDISRHL